MGELVLLVIAAAWAAVLVPPLIRNRFENRPNSSVTDFRRQLNKLQSTVPSRAGAPMRGMARPLAQSPLYRPAAGGRPAGQPAQLRRGAGGRSHGPRHGAEVRERESHAAPRVRSHGDPTGGQRRPRPNEYGHQRGPQRRPVNAPSAASAEMMRRRRSNVLVALVALVGATLFLAATTQSAAMLWIFAIAFLALCAYGYLLSQVRSRESTSWPQDWMHH